MTETDAAKYRAVDAEGSWEIVVPAALCAKIEAERNRLAAIAHLFATADVDGFKRELDAKLAATTDEELRAELELAGVEFTPPADRPTPDVKAMGSVTISRNGYIEDLERQLAEAIESRKESAREWSDMIANASKRESAAKCERDEARYQRDQMAKALNELRDAPWLNLPGRAGDIIESALATLKGGGE